MATINEHLKKLLGLAPRFDTAAVAAYRKSIKIYDVFIFFNELELLEIRLNILAPHVDKFVIVESTRTFAGKPKPLYFDEHRAQFKQFADKIIHYVVDDMPDSEEELRQRLDRADLTPLDRDIITTSLTSDNVPIGQSHWLREFYQKECMRKPLIGLADNDFCFISDVDEIWNPKALIDFRSDRILKMRQLMYAYNLNNRSSEPWAGTYGTKYVNIRNASLNHIDTPSKTSYQYIDHGGWHFTNLGGVERIKTKLESYGHQEFNTDEVKNQLADRLARNEDFIGRKHRFWVDESDLPEYLLKNKTTYSSLFIS